MKNTKNPRPRVCLDAGHYGDYNHSPGIPEYVESRMNWKLHLLLKTELEKYGIQVITTRADEEQDLDLKSRGLASKGCDLFLSLHSNAVGSTMNEAVDYVVLHRLVDRAETDIDEKAAEAGTLLGPVIAAVMGTKQPWRLATRLSENDRDGNGKKDDNYYGVLNGAHLAGTPGLIVEHSFHTNTRSTRWLMEDENLLALAEAEAEAIAAWFGVNRMPFLDVTGDDWFYEDVLWAWGRGITKGRDYRRFDPDAALTRAEAVAMLHRALGE